MADPSYIDADGVLTDGDAWVAVGSTTLGTTTSTVTFTSTDDGQVGDFSQYMDLVMLVYCQQDQADNTCLLNLVLNGSSGASGYNTQWLECPASGTASVATALTRGSRLYGVYTPGTSTSSFGASIWHFADVNAGKYQSIVWQGASDVGVSSGNGFCAIGGGCWMKVEALTSIQCYRASVGFSAGSRFDLYGVLPRMVTA